MESGQTRLDMFIIIKTLGKGGTSKVKLGKNLETGEFVALKIILPEKFHVLRSEIEALTKVGNFPNIIKLLGYSESSQYIKSNGDSKTVSYLVLELCKNGEVFDYISKLGPFPEPISRKCFSELISAIETLHNSGLVHRDLKPENIFFNDLYQIKLADFGFSAPASGRDGSFLLQSFKGTRPYMAPEILERKPYNGISTDIFSAGIILFIFVMGRPPFMRAEKINPHFVNIVNNNWERFWRIHHFAETPNVSDSFRDLIKGMLDYVPERRFTVSEIKNHPWFAQEIAGQAETEMFLSGAMVVDEASTNSIPKTPGYRSTISDEEILTKTTSRDAREKELFIYKSTKFHIDCQPDWLFERIKGLFANAKSIKVHPVNFRMKIQLEDLEFCVEIIDELEKYLVEFSRVYGDWWAFYEAYQNTLGNFTNA